MKLRLWIAGSLIPVAQATAQSGCDGGGFGSGALGGGVPIPDQGSLTYHFNCTQWYGSVRSVTVIVRVHHGRQGDLVIWLRHDASGRVATLINRPGTEDGQSTVGYTAADLGGTPSGGFLQTFVFDDAAPGRYAVPPVGNYPRPGVDFISGSFKPVDPLSMFVGLPMASTWTIQVADAAAGVTGTLDVIGQDVETDAVASCYANCDGTLWSPYVNVNDFTCFLKHYAIGDSYANCDGSTTPPVVNVNDFACFLSKYVAGCSAP